MSRSSTGCTLVGEISPATMRSTVVLPQPDGPSKDTNSPSFTDSDTPAAAVCPLTSAFPERSGVSGHDDVPCSGASARDLALPAAHPDGHAARHRRRIGQPQLVEVCLPTATMRDAFSDSRTWC